MTSRANISETDYRNTSSDWFEIDDDQKTLSIHLDTIDPEYEWKYGISDSLIRECSLKEITDSVKSPDSKYEWTAHFRADPSASGDVILTFQYIKDRDSSSIDTKTLTLHVDDGKICLN